MFVTDKWGLYLPMTLLMKSYMYTYIICMLKVFNIVHVTHIMLQSIILLPFDCACQRIFSERTSKYPFLELTIENLMPTYFSCWRMRVTNWQKSPTTFTDEWQTCRRSKLNMASRNRSAKALSTQECYGVSVSVCVALRYN